MFQKIKQTINPDFLQELVSETRWIYRHAARYRRGIVRFILLSIAATALGLGSTLASKYLIDAVVDHENRILPAIAAVYAALWLSRLLLTALIRKTGTKLSVQASNDIRARIFSRFLTIDWQAGLHYHSGDLLTRVNGDVSAVSDSILGWIPSLITGLFQFLGTLAVILVFDPIMALLALISAPVTVLMSRFLVTHLQQFGRQMRDIQSQLTAFYEEALQNLQAIKSFSLHQTCCDRLDALQSLYRDTRMDYENFSLKVHLLLSTVGMGVSGLCFAWGVCRLWSGHISFGTMVLFIQAAGMLSSSFSSLVGLIPAAISATVSARRLMTILDLPREDLSVSEDARRVMACASRCGVSVQVQNLHFSYTSGRPVFEGFSLHADPGEIIGIISPSGGGKTSFLRVLLGLVTPTSGSVSLLSHGNSAPLRPGLRPLITYVAQEKVVFSGSIADSLRLSNPAADDAQLERALELACARDFVSTLPGGIHYPLKERGQGLSEGQLQRLSIARALLSDAPVMLLDEATSALDLATERTVLSNLLSSHPRRTIIVTTHRPTVLLSCTRVYAIREGKAHLLSQKEIDALTSDRI